MSKWQCRFQISNIEIERQVQLPFERGQLTVIPITEGTQVMIDFETEHVSKPPLLQNATAKIIFEGLLDALTLFCGQRLNAKRTDSTPGDQGGQEEYDKMSSPDSTAYPFEACIKLPNEQLEELTGIYRRFLLPTFRAVPLDEVYFNNLVRLVLRWYARGYKGGRVDKFLSLWIAFNRLYSFIWTRDHAHSETTEVKKIEYYNLNSGLLDTNDSQTISGNPALLTIMPDEHMKQEAIHIAGQKEWKQLVNNPYALITSTIGMPELNT